jgi:hypothetical protein
MSRFDERFHALSDLTAAHNQNATSARAPG